MRSVTTGDTICDKNLPVPLESIDCRARHFRRGGAQDQGGPGKDGPGAGKLAQEDPTFTVHTDAESGQTIISGMGEFHLEIIVDRMMREYKVEANVGKPQVAYRETIRKTARSGRQVHPSDGRQGPVRARARSIWTLNRRRRIRVRKRYYGRSVAQGIHQADRSGNPRGARRRHPRRLSDGRRQGHALRRQLSRCRLQRNGVKIAGSMAFKEAARKASPVLLEPVMAVEVVVPEDYAGAIMGDLSSRRGHIEGMEHRAGSQVIKAMVPLAKCSVTRRSMRSSTQGRAEYSMHFARYEERRRSWRRRSSPRCRGRQVTEVNRVRSEVQIEQSRRKGRVWRKRNLIAPSRT